MSTWKIVFIAYVLTGLVIILATKARNEVFGATTATERAQYPVWKTAALFAIVVPIALIFWPVFLPGWLRKKETIWDKFQASPGIGQLKGLFDAMNELSSDGCDTDEIPGSTGEFGFDLSNPIPTNTVMGSRSYLGKLQMADGGEVRYERIGSFSSPVSDMPVDGYELTDQTGAKIDVIYISPYHRRNSARAPRGLKLLS